MANYSEKGSSIMTGSPFVGGEMVQNPLNDQTQGGYEQHYSQTFGKYFDKDDSKKFSEEDRQKRERAKKANKIYKRVCEDLRLNACFFSNFGDWSDYIDGKMSDAEFQSHAVTRAHQMKTDQN